MDDVTWKTICLIFHILLTIKSMRHNKWIARIMLISAYPALYMMWVNVMRNTWVLEQLYRSKTILFILILMCSILNSIVLANVILQKSTKRLSTTKKGIHKLLKYEIRIFVISTNLLYNE
jgi:hypothetical protein